MRINSGRVVEGTVREGMVVERMRKEAAEAAEKEAMKNVLPFRRPMK